MSTGAADQPTSQSLTPVPTAQPDELCAEYEAEHDRLNQEMTELVTERKKLADAQYEAAKPIIDSNDPPGVKTAKLGAVYDIYGPQLRANLEKQQAVAEQITATGNLLNECRTGD